MQEAAQIVHIFLNELELVSFLKTSGGKGLHVVVPIKRLRDWDTVKDFSQAIVEHLAKAIPPRFVAKSGPSNRVGRIFIDYLRNGLGATTACAWSARARPGLGVSVPLAWEELEALTSGDRWTASNIQDRLVTGNGPWSEYEVSRRSIIPAMKILGFKPR
jgi:bifunctional non-homologous end joining protein LigD